MCQEEQSASPRQIGRFFVCVRPSSARERWSATGQGPGQNWTTSDLLKQSNSRAGNPLASPRKTQAIGRGRLDADLVYF